MVLGTIHSLNHNSDSSQALFFPSQLHIYCNTCQVSTSCRFQFFIYTSLHFMEEIIWVVLKISGILKNHRSTKLEFQGFFSHMYIRYHIVDVLIPFVTKGKNWVTESLDEVLEISWSMLESGKKKTHPILWILNLFQASGKHVCFPFWSLVRGNVKEGNNLFPFPAYFSLLPQKLYHKIALLLIDSWIQTTSCSIARPGGDWPLFCLSGATDQRCGF